MPDLKKVARNIMEELAMEGVLEAVRGYLEEKMRTLTPANLALAIDKDADPWEYTPTDVKSKGAQWAQKLRKHSDKVTPQMVRDWLKEDRPDLYHVIVTKGPKGQAWLVKWTSRVKSQLWPVTGSLVLKASEPPQQPPQREEAPPEPPKGTVRMG